MTFLQKFRKRNYIAIVAAAGMLVLPMAHVGSAGKKSKRYVERTTTLTSGVDYTVIRDYSGPFRIRVVSIEAPQPSTIDTVLANDKLPKFETTSSMAQRSGALVAINGDYARSSGRPVFAFAADGQLAQTSLSWGRNFSMTQDESASYIGHPTETAWATEVDSSYTYPIRYVNRSDIPISASEVRMYTKEGGKEAKPPDKHCLVRLQPLEDPHFASGGAPGVERAYSVERVKCGGRSLKPMGGVILAARPDGQYALALQQLFPGEELTIGWSLSWPGVLDTIGGNPTLIEGGQIFSKDVDGNTYFHRRHPRTGVGTTPDGRVLFVVVDGRQPKYSVGMTLREFAELFSRLGAVWALNLDGGGSSTMVINGEVVNRPSDKKRVERGVSSALVLLPGSDPGEQPQPEPSSSPVLPLNAVRATAFDPASTGGMLDAMARRGFYLDPSLLRDLRAFRASRR